MRKYHMIIIACSLLFVAIIYGKDLLINKGKSTTEPPNAHLVINNKTYTMETGSYCWEIVKNQSECVDTAGPVELVKDKARIKVDKGEQIQLDVSGKLKPNETKLYLISDNKEKKGSISNNKFKSPTKKGTYYYTLGAWWMKNNNSIPYGDVFYAFALEVN